MLKVVANWAANCPVPILKTQQNWHHGEAYKVDGSIEIPAHRLLDGAKTLVKNGRFQLPFPSTGFRWFFRISEANHQRLGWQFHGGMKRLSFPRRQGGIIKVNGGWSSGRIHRLVWQILSLSHEKKNPYYFPWNTGWLIRILIMVYYNPYITG